MKSIGQNVHLKEDFTSNIVVWRLLALLRLGQCRLELVPVWEKPGMFGTQGIWCQRERNQECLVPRVYGASVRGTRNVWYPGYMVPA